MADWSCRLAAYSSSATPKFLSFRVPVFKCFHGRVSCYIFCLGCVGLISLGVWYLYHLVTRVFLFVICSPFPSFFVKGLLSGG